jgi:uncharacterized protein (DUF305 family)
MKQAAMKYRNFAAMIATSVAVMYALTYANTLRMSDVYWSETRGYMALLMGAAMAAVMLGFMKSMYTDRKKNLAILGVASLVFALSVYLVRSQEAVGDIAWMKGMIPHHSIAILTSERAHLKDPRVQALAESIAASQRKEISEMQMLIKDLEGKQQLPEIDKPAE